MRRSSYGERDYPFGQMMLTLRTTIGLTQAGLASQLGVSRNAVAQWEGGSSYPKAEHLQHVIALGVRACAFPARHEEEAIQALWRAARQKVLLDEHWLQELLQRSSSSSPEQGAVGAPQKNQTTTDGTAIWTVPFPRNAHFTGRHELLDQLMQQLAPPASDQPTTIRRAALTQAQIIKGLGGIGKTQTAVEYAYRAREQGRYIHTLWIAAASEEMLLMSFAAVAELLPGVASTGESDQRKLVAAVIRWLEQCPQPWLLIVDNADDLSMTQPYLPLRGNGSVLLTTRASAAGWLASSLEVDVMGVLEGAELLLRRAQRFAGASDKEINEAMNLVLALGQFPLALDQAGAYIEETGCGVADYLQFYQTHRQALLARRGRQATGYPASVATTWALSFQQVEATNPAAADLLRLCAFLAPDHIPEELLTAGAPYWPPALQEAVADRFCFNQMLETLLAFSLVKRLSEHRLLSMHRLVQAVQMERIEPEEQRQWAERVVCVVNCVFPHHPQTGGGDTWSRCQRYLEQAQASDTLIEQHQLLLPEAADVQERTGLYLLERGLYHLAEPLLQRSLAMREQLLGPEHPDIAAALDHLAFLSLRQGRYKEAEALSQQAVRMCEQLLEPEHPDVAISLADQAVIYVALGKYTEAELLYQRAIAIEEKVLGPEHPELVIQLYNLAELYSQMSKPAQAEALFLRVLSIWEDRLGPEHPKVLSLLSNLATLYFSQGKYAQAEPLFLRALHIGEQQLGPEHPETAFPLLGRAGIMAVAGNYEEAERLARQALRIWEEQLGPEHPSVAHALWGLALISAQQGRASHAEALFERALRIREQQLGETHLLTALVLQDFAGFRRVQGQTKEAVALYQRALSIREHVLGSEHPLTVKTRDCLQELFAVPDQVEETKHMETQQQKRAAPAQSQ